MITRPLDLASHLRPPPRSFEFLSYINIGLVVVFFSLFGSRFILAPGLGVDFQVPEQVGAAAGASQTSHQITVINSGQIFADDGLVSIPQLGDWLIRERPKTAKPSLLVLAGAKVPNDEMAEIFSVARKADFSVLWGALEPAKSSEAAGR